MKTLPISILSLSAFVPLAHGAISFSAVGVYDAGTDGNVVDASQTPLTAAAHASNVATAFANGTGGVVNFDDGTGGTSGTWNIAYGSGQTLSVGIAGGQLNMATADVAAIKSTPISGNAYYRLGFNSTTLTFGSTLLSEFGLTLLARSTDRTLNNITVTLSDGQTVTLLDTPLTLTANTVTSSSNYLTESGSGTDHFFGYTAPEGLAITQIVINGGENLIMDDFGFITSPIPEPSVALLGVAGAAVGLARRRRL